jgi:hypothetical protein
MGVRHAKNTLDAGFVSNADLDVSFFKKPCLIVDKVALDEHGFHGLEGW